MLVLYYIPTPSLNLAALAKQDYPGATPFDLRFNLWTLLTTAGLLRESAGSLRMIGMEDTWQQATPDGGADHATMNEVH